MAAATDREASRVRLLTMAADFEARAALAQDAAPPQPAEETAVSEETPVAEALKAKPSRRSGGGSKMTLSSTSRSL